MAKVKVLKDPILQIGNQSSTDRKLKIVSISDIHLGHNRVSTLSIVHQLNEYFYPEIADADLVIIAGDVYESLLDRDSTESMQCLQFVTGLLWFCNQHGIVLRLLRGTYSHDRDQPRDFEVIHRECRYTNDFRYIDRIEVETIQSLGISMAYLPDDLPYGSSGDCLENLFKLLHDRGLQQVDYAITHGYFRHVLPKGATREPECVYTAEQFSPFVRRRVVSGHVHTSSSYNDFVYYNGSFSRLNHGEEEDKGFWVFEDSSSKLTSRFVVNKEAPPFYTFDLSKTKDRDAAIEVFLSRMKKKFRTQEDFGFVRVVHQSGEIIKTIAKVCSTKYPNIVYTHKTIDGSVAQAQVAMCQIAPLTDRPIPTKENLPDLLSTFLSKQQINRSAEEIRACLQTLQ